MLKDRMIQLMRESKLLEKKSVEWQMGYADGCLDMYNEACREYGEIFAEQVI